MGNNKNLSKKKEIMQTRKIQLKHPHGPIMVITEYLPEME